LSYLIILACTKGPLKKKNKPKYIIKATRVTLVNKM
jgi:hypothetical protein